MPPKPSTNDYLAERPRQPSTFRASLTSNNNQTYNQIKQTPTPKTNQNQPKPPNQSWVTVDAPALLPATAEAAAPAPRAENKSLWLPNLHTSISHPLHTPCGTCAMGRFDKSGWSYDGRGAGTERLRMAR
ncbi:hypothetical protein V499_08295 [Pseudogymnoascus sp. VKM F-103]|nr:hypothetical protein V499_08295 [Pseudogymnoascus sp. VKM F-103]